MAAIAETRFPALSCVVGLLAGTAALLAQSRDGGAALIGQRAPALAVTPGDSGGRPALWAFLPESRTAYLAAERQLAGLERELGERVAIVALLPAGSAERLGALRGRGARGRFPRVEDARDRLRGVLLGGTDVGAGAGYVLLDAASTVLRLGRLDAAARHEAEDLAAGRLDFASALALVGRGEARSTVTVALDASDPAASPLAHAAPWCRELGRLPAAVETRTLRARLDAALRALRDRPAFQVQVLAIVAARWPAELMRDTVRATLADAVRAERGDAATQRAGFLCYVACDDLRRAESCGFAWLEADKGVPGRMAELLDVLDGIPDGARHFPQLTSLALDVGRFAEPGDQRLLLRTFEHRARVLGDVEAAGSIGRELIAAIGPDAQALNSWAWALLTREPYTGHYAELALAAARAMQDDPDWRTYWRVDTLALACFENGLVDEAIRLQREAVDGADPSAAVRYRERLERYEAAQR
ncbi:MAG: hypothetical protein IPM29_19125 [Planctomycetes bacterium]|nr:hypothetical protein [Planctomycetota bacterium]